jgi:hypothetical protein
MGKCTDGPFEILEPLDEKLECTTVAILSFLRIKQIEVILLRGASGQNFYLGYWQADHFETWFTCVKLKK